MTPYALDKSNAAILGVCAGFARWADVDPFLVRVSAALLGIFLGPLMILAYIVTALLAQNG